MGCGCVVGNGSLDRAAPSGAHYFRKMKVLVAGRMGKRDQ